MTDAQVQQDGLRRAAPREAGVNAAVVEGFLADAAATGLDIHGFMLHRGGRVVAEGWRWPYRADRPRIMHSATKSVLACARRCKDQADLRSAHCGSGDINDSARYGRWGRFLLRCRRAGNL